ncbi:protein NinF [Proteus mirabilis]
MNCMSCNRQLTDDEIYVCAQCADEYVHLEVMDKIKGEGDGEVSQ